MKRLFISLFRVSLVCLSLTLVQCKNSSEEKNEDQELEKEEKDVAMSIKKESFGVTKEGDSIEKITVSNQDGLEMSVITYGGIIQNLKVPDKNGNYEDVVLGFDSISQYENGNPYFGALIGRYGNRIAGGKFSLEGEDYQLETNDGPNHLHGGEKGFDKKVWAAETSKDGESAVIRLSYESADGEGGYPGNLKSVVTYTLTPENELNIKYEAETDKTTIVNLTQHSYFNLSGDFSKTILDHVVEINADEYLPVDATLIPTGELKPVEDTPFDFREPKEIGKDLSMEDSNEQLKRGMGYDHCWVLNEQDAGMRFAASVYHAESGRFMEVTTNEPAIQFYIGNFLDGTLPAKGGGNYEKRTGLCLETQHYPDSPNQEAFPSVVLEPGETYTSETSYKFSTK